MTLLWNLIKYHNKQANITLSNQTSSMENYFSLQKVFLRNQVL